MAEPVRPVDNLDIVVAGMLDAIKYLLREDRCTAEQKLKSATERFLRHIESRQG